MKLMGHDKLETTAIYQNMAGEDVVSVYGEVVIMRAVDFHSLQQCVYLQFRHESLTKHGLHF